MRAYSTVQQLLCHGVIVMKKPVEGADTIELGSGHQACGCGVCI